MKQYIAKYYPLVDGKETEYTTTVEAKDKISAEALIREAFAEQIKRILYMTHQLNMQIIGCDISDLTKAVEYAKKMRVVII